ncbi:MAG: glycosyltransferase family 2 protein [Anaerolineaceae bacterium]
MTKLVIQIPAYNEAKTLPDTLADIPREYPGVEDVVIIVIDDGSTDGTAQIALENGADYVVRHRTNRGLSDTFLTGLLTSLAMGANIIVNTDADNQYPGGAIGNLIQPILDNSADLVLGDRQPMNNSNFSRSKGILETIGSWCVRIVSETNVPDAVSGFRAYSRYAALRMQVHNRYSYTIETLIQAGRDKMKIDHIPITTNPSIRSSRLHRGFMNFIWNQSGAIIRSFILYQPLKAFTAIGSVFLITGMILLLRFLFFYLIGDSGVGRYIQSVSIGGTLATFGFLLIIMGFLGDAIRANRQLMVETLAQMRDKLMINQSGDLNEIIGEPIFRRTNSNDASIK